MNTNWGVKLHVTQGSDGKRVAIITMQSGSTAAEEVESDKDVEAVRAEYRVPEKAVTYALDLYKQMKE